MSDLPLITEKANYGARAGETIAGNLVRGGDGKFSSGGNATATSKKPPQSYGGKRAAANAKLQQRLAARRAAAAKKAKPKGKVAAKPKGGASSAAAARRAEAEKRRQVRAAEAAKRKADRDAAKIKRDQDRKVAAADRDAKKLQRDQERAAAQAKRKADQDARRAEIERRRAERAKGGSGKGKAAPKAKPSKVAEQELQREQNRAKVQAATLDAGAFAALVSLAGGEQPDPAGAEINALVKSGLVERDSVGGYRVSSAGRSYTAAADSGDIGRAKDAMSRAADRAARRDAIRSRRTDPPVRQTTKERASTSVAVFKQANGVYRWLGVSSTAYQDRDRQFVSLKALERDCERADLDGQYGPLRFWHMPGVDIGTTDFNAVIGRSLVESGEIPDARIGHALATSKEHWQMSLGFLHPRDQPQGDTYTYIRRFERSILPAAAASNPFTSLLVYNKGNTMSASLDEKLAKLKELAGDPDLLATLLAGVDSTEKAADAAGVRFKEAGAGAEDEGASAETKAAGDEEAAALEGDAAEDDAAAGTILEDADLDAIAERVAAKLAPMFEAMAGATMKQAATVAMPSNLDKILDGFSQVAERTKEAADKATATAQAASDKATADAAELATLKQRLAELEGDQPRGTAGGYRASQAGETVATKAHMTPAEDELIKAAGWLVG